MHIYIEYGSIFETLHGMSEIGQEYILESMYQLTFVLTLTLTSTPKPKNITLIIRKPTPLQK